MFSTQQYATGLQAKVIGKPSETFFMSAIKQMGAPAENVSCCVTISYQFVTPSAMPYLNKLSLLAHRFSEQHDAETSHRYNWSPNITVKLFLGSSGEEGKRLNLNCHNV